MFSIIEDLSLFSAIPGVELLKHMPNIDFGVILDIATGTGFPALDIASRNINSEVIAIDYSEDALKIVKEKSVQRNIKNIVLLKCNAENIPIQDKYVDLIVSNNGIGACIDKVAVLEECHRLLKGNGIILFSVMLDSSMDIINYALKKVFFELGIDIGFEKIYQRRRSYRYYCKILKKLDFSILIAYKYTYGVVYSNGRSILNNYIIKTFFLSQWESVLSKEQRGKFEEDLINKLDELNKRIHVNLDYGIFMVKKNE